jgi:hypothetical protein
MSLIVELNTSPIVFYLLKHLLLLNLVIFTLKSNNLIVNEILVLNALYMCLLHSRFVEKHLIWILKDKPLISEVVLSHRVHWDTDRIGRGMRTAQIMLIICYQIELEKLNIYETIRCSIHKMWTVGCV